MIDFEQKNPGEIGALTQQQLSSKAGMSLASYKRFEQKGLVAFDSLIRVAIALGCEDDFGSLFAKRGDFSIEEVIRGRKR